MKISVENGEVKSGENILTSGLEWWTCYECGYVTDADDDDCPRCGEGLWVPGVWHRKYTLVVCDEEAL